MSRSMAVRNRFVYWTLNIRYLSEAIFDLLKMPFLFIQAICNIEYYSGEVLRPFQNAVIFIKKHIFVIYMPLFNSILLQYWKQSSQPLTTFWILLFLHCLKSLRHTELAARLWGCFFTFFEIHLYQGCASQPPHNSDKTPTLLQSCQLFSGLQELKAP